mgnify:CR=1 FL=1
MALYFIGVLSDILILRSCRARELSGKKESKRVKERQIPAFFIKSVRFGDERGRWASLRSLVQLSPETSRIHPAFRFSKSDMDL